MTTTVPLRKTPDTHADVGFLAYLMESTEPELHALALEGETGEERAARLAAASDIVDELVVEFCAAGMPDPEHDPLDDFLTGGGDPFFELDGRAAA